MDNNRTLKNKSRFHDNKTQIVIWTPILADS